MTKQKSSHIRLSADNNFFKFPICIVEPLLKAGLSGAEWSVMFLIIRQTYGWGKQSDIITIKQFQANIPYLHRDTIDRALHKLKNRGLIDIEKQSFKEGGHKANKITILLGVNEVVECNNKRAEKLLDTHHDQKVERYSETVDQKVERYSETVDQKVERYGRPKSRTTIDIKNQYIEESIDRRESIDKDSPPAVSKTQPSGDSNIEVSSPSLSEEELEQHKHYKKDLRNRLSLLDRIKEKKEYFEAGSSQELLQRYKELLQRFENENEGVMCIPKQEFDDFEWRVGMAIFKGQSAIDKSRRKTA